MGFGGWLAGDFVDDHHHDDWTTFYCLHSEMVVVVVPVAEKKKKKDDLYPKYTGYCHYVLYSTIIIRGGWGSGARFRSIIDSMDL